MWQTAFIFICSVALVIKGATFSTKYAARLADSFGLSRYAVGFIIVSFISILPETFVAINSALTGMPSFGLGTLFGSNVADMTFVFAVIIALAGRNISIESKILAKNKVYPLLMLLPLVLGLDGFFSRAEGAALIIFGGIFYYSAFKTGVEKIKIKTSGTQRAVDFLMLLLGMAILIVGSHFTVVSAANFAGLLRVSPIIIGMLLVGLGTTMPEMFFALKAAKKREDDLAVGDILGTVLADATVVVGILAVIRPFAFPVHIIYVTGVFMVTASILLLTFMRTGKKLSKKEAVLLFLFWLAFVCVEILMGA